MTERSADSALPELSPLHRALLAIKQQRARIEELERQQTEPVAVIGLACRFPGAADEDTLWRLLREGVDAVGEVPPERWEVDAYYDAAPEAPGKMYTRSGGFLEDIDQFDAAFFGISPREAGAIDPQHRLLLETSWEALESAGQVGARLAGSRTGVFFGICGSDYLRLQILTADFDRITAYSGIGTAASAAAGRLSYLLGLTGPSLVVDTACSSSLVAVHLAAESLRRRESDLALAGGVNVMLSPDATIYFCKLRALASDGRCKTFDSRADGYVRSEGCGVVVLKRLSDAVADGDPIQALIVGSALHHDGRSSGLTVPSGPAQQAVIRAALASAGLGPDDLDYVEAHGSGTPLGDAIELRSLAEVFLNGTARDRPLWIGSGKSNLGHTEAAAGIAGLIKTVLGLRHGEMPPHLHLETATPELVPGFRVPSEATAWLRYEGPRRAGVSSFGFSGTNAHVIVAEAASAPPTTDVPERATAHILTFSARSAAALRVLAEAYLPFLDDDSVALADLCFTAAVRRTLHDHRLAAAGSSRQEIRDCLSAFLAGEARAGLSSGAAAERRPRMVWVFPGQGSQWRGMGAQLLAERGAFCESLEQTSRAMLPLLGWSALEALARSSDVDRTERVQPLLFAVQVALAAQWRDWGLEPDAVVGYSMGEVAAALVAGVLSLDDAVRVSCMRSRALERASGGGAMAAVEMPVGELEPLLAAAGGRATVAGISSSTSTVISGEASAVQEVIDECERRGVFCRAIRANVAAHSPQLDFLKPELLEVLRGVTPQAGTVPIFSTVTGGLEGGAVFDAEYWVRNLRQPVLFHAAVRRLIASGHRTFVELSAHPVLLAPLKQTLRDAAVEGTLLPSLRRDEIEPSTMLASLGALHVGGHSVEWSRVQSPRSRCVALPRYPWQRQRHWFEADEGRRARHHIGTAQRLDVADCLYEMRWRSRPATAVPAAPEAGGHWLILADRAGTGEALASRLVDAGQRAVLAFAGDAYERLAGDRCRLAAGREEQLRQVLGELLPTGATWRGVVNLWTLDDQTSEPGGMAPSALVVSACAGLAALARALTGLPAPPRLWVATCGGQSVDDRPPVLSQAPTWAFCRALGEELPGLWGGLADLDPTADPGQSATALAVTLLQPDGEDQVAFRGPQRYVPRLEHSALGAATVPFRLRPDGTYLITGGLGHLGLRLARWAVDAGARRLVLVGRSSLTRRLERDSQDACELAVRELEARGAGIKIASLDVADDAAVEGLLGALADQGWPGLRGVFHAAGIVSPQRVVELDEAALRDEMRAKVDGSWLLHEKLKDVPLDCFVLFSSAAVQLGSPLLAAYAAANAFMDALAYHRRADGLPALTVNWGFWGGLSMSSASIPRGMQRFPPAIGLRALERLLAAGVTQGIVLNANWPEWARFHAATASSRPLCELVDAGHTPAAPAAASRLTRRSLLAAAPPSRLQLLQDYLHQEAARVLRQAPSDVDLERTLQAHGMDSLMALELSNRVEADLEASLPLAQVLGGATLSLLAQLLLEEIASGAAIEPLVAAAADDPTAAAAGGGNVGLSAEAGAALLAGVSGLSEPEVDLWLAKLLKASNAR